jgi:hypothetical protein
VVGWEVDIRWWGNGIESEVGNAVQYCLLRLE